MFTQVLMNEQMNERSKGTDDIAENKVYNVNYQEKKHKKKRKENNCAFSHGFLNRSILVYASLMEVQVKIRTYVGCGMYQNNQKVTRYF